MPRRSVKRNRWMIQRILSFVSISSTIEHNVKLFRNCNRRVRFNPRASLKLRVCSLHDAWSPVQLLTRASHFLTRFPFTPPHLFPRRLFSFLKRRWNCALVVTRRSPPFDFQPFTWPRFPRRFADCMYRLLCPLSRQRFSSLSSCESIECSSSSSLWRVLRTTNTLVNRPSQVSSCKF